MNFISGLTGYSIKSEHQTRILLHGKLIYSIGHEQTVSEFSYETLKKRLIGTRRPLLFLASPYIHSYIHTTIQLSSREMETADQQLFGFRNPASPFIMVTSLKLNDKKALTIHSHLSKIGADLLAFKRREKVSFIWHPAVSSFITTLFQGSVDLLHEKGRLRIYLANELLQIEKQDNQLRCQHLNYLQNQKTFEDKKRTAERILEKSEGKQEYTTLIFADATTPDVESSNHLVDPLLFPPVRNRQIKTVTRIQKKRSLAFRSIIKRNNLLGIATFAVIVWAILINLHVSQINQQRLTKKRSIHILEQHSARLDQIAEIRLKYIRFVSIRQTANSLKIYPARFLARLDKILPRSVWVRSFAIRDDLVTLELLDSGKSGISTLMDQISRQCGETNLKSNEPITLEKTPIRKYAIEIKHLNSQTHYEKLD